MNCVISVLLQYTKKYIIKHMLSWKMQWYVMQILKGFQCFQQYWKNSFFVSKLSKFFYQSLQILIINVIYLFMKNAWKRL